MELEGNISLFCANPRFPKSPSLIQFPGPCVGRLLTTVIKSNWMCISSEDKYVHRAFEWFLLIPFSNLILLRYLIIRNCVYKESFYYVHDIHTQHLILSTNRTVLVPPDICMSRFPVQRYINLNKKLWHSFLFYYFQIKAQSKRMNCVWKTGKFRKKYIHIA